MNEKYSKLLTQVELLDDRQASSIHVVPLREAEP
jgi:hypothetical protein